MMMLNFDRSTWKRVRFGDVVRQVKTTIEPETSGLERYIAGEHMDTDELRISRWGVVGDGYLGPAFHRAFKVGQVLYGSRRTYLRKVAYADFDGICANTTFVAESSDPTVLLPELLPFLMTTEAFHTHSIAQSKGSVNPYINWSDLAWYEFDLPPLDDQKRITDLMWSVEKAAAAQGVVAKELRRVLAVESDEFFGRSRYPTRACKELCHEITVGVVVRPAQYYASTGVPALRSLNVAPNRFVLDDLVRFESASHAILTKSTLKKGNVVIVRTGRPGDAAVVDDTTDGFNCIDLIIARPSPELDSHYLARFLNSAAGRAGVLKHAAGTAQQHFNVGALAQLRVPLPPLERQCEVTNRLEFIERAEADAQAAVRALRQLRGVLLNTLWSRSHDVQ
jgi:type I restriction enzyme, S subunit